LVNLETTFYTTPNDIDRTLAILGYRVDVHLYPVSYAWHWGDGSTQTTDDPGRPYPATGVTHTYANATDPGQPLSLRVDITYSGRYRVDGSDWTPVPEPITVDGRVRALAVKQASTVLITDD
jgi:hypothetical protein